MAVVKEEHRYGKNSAETFADLEQAITIMGTINKIDRVALIIEGKIKFGLGAKTKVKAEVQQEGNESIISFESRGGDVFGTAAHNNVERLFETMSKAHDPDFDVNKADKRQWLGIGFTVLAVILVFLAYFAVTEGLVSLELAGGVVGGFLLLAGILLRKLKSA
jgi:hypothetical protein